MSERLSPGASLLPALTLRQVQYFVALAHARSFTQAAQSLSLTQPALTSAIRQIEYLLGGPLFARSAHRLALTEAGASILPLAERLIHHARGTFDDMASTFTEQYQTVRIAMIPSIAGRLLPVLNAFRQQYPSLRFTLADLPNSALVEAIMNGTVDIGIGVHEADVDDRIGGLGRIPALVGKKSLADSGKNSGHHSGLPSGTPSGTDTRRIHERLRFQDVLHDEIVVVVRRDDPLAKLKSLSWPKLVGRDLAVFVRGSVSDLLGRTGGAENLQLNVAYRMEYTEPLYALVRNGLAIAVLPSLYTMHLHDPELRALRIDKPRVTRAIALIALEGEDRGPHVKACWNYIAANMTSITSTS